MSAADMKHSAPSAHLPLSSILTLSLFLQCHLAVSVYANLKTLKFSVDLYFQLQTRSTDHQ
jgi:hypothetical protein